MQIPDSADFGKPGNRAMTQENFQDKETAMSNIVYVLTNSAMPNLVKIGRTTREAPELRMNELYSTGVPLPFECAVAIELEEQQADGLERALHIAFGPNRLNPRREFFEIEVEQVEAILRQFPGNDVTPGINKESDDKLDAAEQRAVKKAKERRPNLNFEKMNVPIGSTLTCLKTGEEITVTGSRTVLCRGEERSLSGATRTALGLEHDIAPCPQWLFEGRNLGDIYEETYGPPT